VQYKGDDKGEVEPKGGEELLKLVYYKQITIVKSKKVVKTY